MNGTTTVFTLDSSSLEKVGMSAADLTAIFSTYDLTSTNYTKTLAPLTKNSFLATFNSDISKVKLMVFSNDGAKNVTLTQLDNKKQAVGILTDVLNTGDS